MKFFSQLTLALTFPLACLGIEFSNLQKIEPGDTPEQIIEKAAHVVPTDRQQAYLKNEFIGFIHFGPNTFSGKEWGNGMEDPASFAPEVVDTDNWCKNMKAAGITLVVMTFKHHDGYILWQSRYEDHQTIKNSPYKNGKGDIAKQLSKSCEKSGLKFGVYLSPADLYQIESKVGLYGNGSKYQKSIIPTKPETFKTDPMQVRKDKPADAPTFTYECDDYNRYMLNQLYEMLTEYGPVHEVWFDGAHPKRKGGQTYTYDNWYSLIRKLAPEAVIFGKGPDVRWCGNEAGRTRQSEWNVVPLQTDPAKFDWPDNTPQDIGSRKKLMDAKYLYYRPAETNTSIRHGWFWRDDSKQGVRTADDVFDIYERSVGGNSVFMLNVPPNRDGVFSPRDEACLIEVGKRIRATYDTDLAKGATLSQKGLQDGDLATYWQPKLENAELTINFKKPTTLNRFLLQEAISERGERIEKHALDAWIDGSWKELTTSTNVGHKRILRFPTVTTEKLRLRVLESRLDPTIAEISAHFYKQPPLPVTAKRNAEGKIELALEQPAFHGKGGGHKTQGLTIRYTTDGSEPTEKSSQYTGPIMLQPGATLKARSFSSAAAGAITSIEFGLDSSRWKVTASSEESGTYDAAKAIDGDPQTFWHTQWSGNAPKHPHTLTIQMEAKHTLTGFAYLPRQDKRVPDSMVEQWKVETSTDGKNWTVAAEGEFGNLLNDPSKRKVDFAKAIQAKFFRFTSLRGAQDKPYAGAAEIELFSN